MIKFLRFRKLKNKNNKNNKNKYEIILIKDGKFITRKFGKKIKSLKNIRTKDPTNVKILTKFILANKPTLSGGLADYKRRLKIYNKTGKFPMNIRGLKFKNKKSKYGLVDYLGAIEIINLFGYSVPENVVNKKLYLSIKNKIKKSIKGRRWGAYDSGRLVKMYKSLGGRYSGKKGKTNLGRWYSEKWIDACAWPKRKSCGRKTKSSIAYCRPSKRVDSKTPRLIQSLTRSQIKSRCSRKKRNPKNRIK
jgi:hypothetical protein